MLARRDLSEGSAAPRRRVRACGLLAILALLTGAAHEPARAQSQLEVSSEPPGAAVFHFLRGHYYFLGYAPVHLTPDKLDGKTDVRLLLARTGYRTSLFDVSLTEGERVLRLAALTPPYVTGSSGGTPKDPACIAGAGDRIRSLIQSGTPTSVDIRLPMQWAEAEWGSRLVAVVHVLNADDVATIKKAARSDRDTAIKAAEAIIDPLAQRLVNSLRDLQCLNALLVIADYRDAGLKIDFSPYESYWTATSEYVIGHTKYIVTATGSTVEQQAQVVVNKDVQSFLFQYRLH